MVVCCDLRAQQRILLNRSSTDLYRRSSILELFYTESIFASFLASFTKLQLCSAGCFGVFALKVNYEAFEVLLGFFVESNE